MVTIRNDLKKIKPCSGVERNFKWEEFSRTQATKLMDPLLNFGPIWI